LVLDTGLVGVAFRDLAFLRRNTHRARAAIKERRTSPPTTAPAITPLFTDALSLTGVGEVVDGSLGEDVVGSGEEVEVELMVRPGDGEMDGDGVNTHDKSGPLATKKMLDGRA